MQQLRGTAHTLACRTQIQGAPTAVGDGTALSASLITPLPKSPPYKHKRLWIKVVIAGAGTCNLTLWVSDSLVAGNNWGVPTDSSGNLALLANGANLAAGTYFFIFEDVGHCAEMVLVQSGNAGGTPTTTATFAALVEKQESK